MMGNGWVQESLQGFGTRKLVAAQFQGCQMPGNNDDLWQRQGDRVAARALFSLNPEP